MEPHRDRDARPVLVVGAGPVGLMAATELARRGVNVRVVERASQPSQRSRALLVWPRSLEVLRRVLPPEQIAARSLPVSSFRYYSQSRPVVRMGFDVHTRPVTMPQPAVEDLLATAATEAGAQIERGLALSGLRTHPDRVTARLEGPGGGEGEYSYVIGADGAGSTVRGLLGLGFQGHTYPSTFMLGDVHVEGAPEHDAVHYYCSREGILVLIGLPGGRCRVFTSSPPGHPADADPATHLAALQAMTDLRGPGGLRLHDAAWTTTFAVHARRATRYRVGRVFLAGDAVHIHSPAGGQGLNTGLTDAHNLAWKIASVWYGHSDPALLDTYEPEREQVAGQVIRQADLQTRAWLVRSPAGTWLRDQGARMAGRLELDSRLYLPWLAGVRAHYPHGAVRGGRRRSGRLRHFVPGALAPAHPVPAGPDGRPTPLREALSDVRHTLLVLDPLNPQTPGAPPHDLAQHNPTPHDVEVRVLRGDRPQEWMLGPALAVHPRAVLGLRSVLVRPDGHVAALAGPGGSRDLSAYLDAYLTPASRPPGRTGPGTRAEEPAARTGA